MSSSLKSFQNKCQEIHLNHEKKFIQSSLKVEITKMQPRLFLWMYKPSCKSKIMMKKPLLRFTVFTVFQQHTRELTWLFQLLILVLFLIWGSFFNFKSNDPHLYGTKLQDCSTWTVLQVTSHSEVDSSPLAGRRRAEQAAANMSCSETQTMLSVLVFMCRDPGDATSTVSCCVQTSYCFKYTDFHVIVKVPHALHWRWVWPENKNTVHLKSSSLVVILLLHEGLTQIHSQKQLRLHFCESLTLRIFMLIQWRLSVRPWAQC